METKKKSKKAMEVEMIGWIGIAVAILVIMVVGYIILKGKGSSAIDFIQNLFRLRR